MTPKMSVLDQKRNEVVDQLFDDASARAKSYRKEVNHRQVAPIPSAVEQLTAFDEPFPEASSDPLEVISMLDERGSPATMGMAGSRFFGFVIGSSLPVTVAADWLATAWDQNCGLYVATPITAKLEEVGLRWLVELFQLPKSTGGAFVTGAAMANFSCLAAARHSVMKNAGWDVEANGLIGAPPVTVVVSREPHPTVIKALGLLGLGRNRVVELPVDDQGRILPGNLPDIKQPAIVCIQAGNVNTGSFDPAPELISWAHEHKAWVHVDAAFGIWAAVSPKLEHLTRGINQADSWATDAHKWLNVPYDSGLALVRDAETLRNAMTLSAAYLPVSEHREPGQYTPELSRRSRGVEVWAAMKSLGREGLKEMVERTCTLARRFSDGLRDAGYDILNEVVLNQVLVSFGSGEVTNRIIRKIQDDGTCWCGGTVWQDRTAMRISVCSWSTTEEDVDKSLEAMLRIANEENRQV